MPDSRSRVDGARVLADLNAILGAGKTGVHKPTFSEPHMRSLGWPAQRDLATGRSRTADDVDTPGLG
jgi:N-carbamoyl-L-amino-acid hydrolase